MLMARRTIEALPEFGKRAYEFDEVDFTACVVDGADCVGNETGAHCRLRRKSEDESFELGAASLCEDGEPDIFAQCDERWRAELEDREKKIDNQVIVEEPETCHRGEFLRNGQFTGCGEAVEEDEFQAKRLRLQRAG